MKNHKLILSVSAAVLLFGSAACRPDNPVPDPDPTENYVWIEPNIERTGAHVALLEKQDDGSYLIELPTSDPYIYFFPFEEDLPGENTVLAFEYKAENAIDRTQCFFIDAEEGLNAAHAQDGPGAAATDTWTPYSVRMKTAMAEFSWGEEGDYLRLDLGESIVPGSTIRLRNICIRPMNASEQAEQDKEDEASGKYIFSYGTEEVEIENVKQVMWKEGSVICTILEQTGTLDMDELVSMAEEVMNL